MKPIDMFTVAITHHRWARGFSFNRVILLRMKTSKCQTKIGDFMGRKTSYWRSHNGDFSSSARVISLSNTPHTATEHKTCHISKIGWINKKLNWILDNKFFSQVWNFISTVVADIDINIEPRCFFLYSTAVKVNHKMLSWISKHTFIAF